MPFPSNWMQTWINWPLIDHRNFATLLQWWSVSIPAPVGWSPVPFVASLDARWRSAWGSILTSTVRAAPDDAGYNVYWGGGGYPANLHFGSGGIWSYPIGNPRPARCGVVVQRYTDSTDRRKRGRFIVPGVDESHLDGDRLTSAGLAAFQGAADIWADSLVDQGVVYRPVVVSYADSTMTEITRHIVRPRLGTVMRRNRDFIFPHFVPGLPKTPPP